MNSYYFEKWAKKSPNKKLQEKRINFITYETNPFSYLFTVNFI